MSKYLKLMCELFVTGFLSMSNTSLFYHSRKSDASE
jgi:hypothetical protein